MPTLVHMGKHVSCILSASSPMELELQKCFCTCAKPSMENEDTHSILFCSTQEGNEER